MIERKLRVQPELFLVGVIPATDAIVGTVLAGFDGVRGWVHHLAVAAPWRRRGVGTALMRAAETGLERLGCPKVNLQIRANNETAARFYERLGYAIEARLSMGRRLGPWTDP